LIFGNKSLSRYARGLDLKECIPDSKDYNRVKVEREIRRIYVHLL
jgi:hypothetical protein